MKKQGGISRGLNLAAFVAVVALVSACGGAGKPQFSHVPSGGSGGGAAPDLSGEAPEVAAGIGDLGAEVLQPVASAVHNQEQMSQPTAQAGGTDFDSSDTGGDLTFPVGSALVRSSDGDDYAYIWRQDGVLALAPQPEYQIVDFPGEPAGGDAACAAGASLVAGDSCLFQVVENIPDQGETTLTITVTARAGEGLFLCAGGRCTNAAAVRGFSRYDLIGGHANVGGFDFTSSPGEPRQVGVAAQTQVWGFQTDTAPADVSATRQNIANQVSGDEDVKGARNQTQRRIVGDDGAATTATRTTDAYFLENQYTGFGIWAEEFATWQNNGMVYNAVDNLTGVFHYGLATPPDGMPTSGTARYRGRAFGFYMKEVRANGDVDASDRFYVEGGANLTADFGAGEISGTASLTAHRRHNFEQRNGNVQLDFTEGQIDGSQFNAQIQIRDRFPATPEFEGGRNTFEDLSDNALIQSGHLTGQFGGPQADEAVGTGLLITENDGPTPTQNILQFGILTKRN